MSDPPDPLGCLLANDRRYKRDAYEFVWKALAYAQHELGMGSEGISEPVAEELQGDEESRKPQRHVTGQELCEAIRRFALREYGFMAKSVLNSWGIQCTADFGEIVFNFIRIGWMRKTRDDRREDFHDQYDFATAFQQEFRITLPD